MHMTENNKLRFKLIILLLTIIFNNNLGQDKPSSFIKLDLLDVYILQYRVDTLIAPFKHYNCSPSKIKRMALYQIEILKVIRQSDTISNCEKNIKKVKFVLSPVLMIKGEYIGSFYPSSSPKYLFFNRFMHIDSITKYDFIQHAYLSESSCLKRDKALKLIQVYEKNKYK